MKVLILGAAGMLGRAVVDAFSHDSRFSVTGTVRTRSRTDRADGPEIIGDVDVLNQDTMIQLFARVCPDVVVNCVGIIKQLTEANDPLVVLPINALLPHRLLSLCELGGARLVHVSTDCVFSGRDGMYVESDFPDAGDLYGRSKLLGEVQNAPHAITLRTSIIGHGRDGHRALVDWFLSQEGSVKGFTRAIFSGLTTMELARVIRDIVLPARELTGLYHVSAEPISKLDLLRLIAGQYGKSIEIVPDESVVIDRSLDSSRFKQATGYVPPPWPELIAAMHDTFVGSRSGARSV